LEALLDGRVQRGAKYRDPTLAEPADELVDEAGELRW
jgi:hypothetical protein